MNWLYYLTLACLLVTGLGLNLFGLPGLWLMVVSHLLYGWATGWQLVGWHSLLALLLLATSAEVAEFVAGAAGSKKAGGAFRSALGAIVGGFAGGILGAILIPFVPILNAIAGACVGSFLGAALMESTSLRRDVDTARVAWRSHWHRVGKVGWGAFTGRLWGILLKTAFGLAILLVSLWTAWG